MGAAALPYIVIGAIVVVAIGLSVLISVLNRRQREDLEARGVEAEAKVISIRREDRSSSSSSTGSDFPGFKLWVRYGPPEQNLTGWIRLNYWTARTNFPELIKTDGGGAETTMHMLSRAKEFTELSQRMDAEGRSKEEIRAAVLALQEENAEERLNILIPVIYDPDRPRTVIVDYRKVQKKNGGFARFGEG